MTHDRRAFIARETRLRAPPLVPEIVLHLADESIPLWQKTEEELAADGLPPPFWAFAWAGGQALARYILDQPHLVRGRRVLDFAAGSGLVAIAAAKSGAREIIAAEIDPFAEAAILANATANEVKVAVTMADIVGSDEGWDVVLAGDICYERDLAARVFSWLQALQARGAMVRIGDPGRSYLPKERLVALESYAVPVTRELEDAEIKRSTVWLLGA